MPPPPHEVDCRTGWSVAHCGAVPIGLWLSLFMHHCRYNLLVPPRSIKSCFSRSDTLVCSKSSELKPCDILFACQISLIVEAEIVR